MKTHSTTPDEASGPDDWPQRCMLYLLGELDAEQNSEFEQRLATSPKLGEELVRQAEAIAAVSSTNDFPHATVLPATSRQNPWPMVASLLAIATCFSLVVIGLRRSEPEQTVASLGGSTATADSVPGEDLLIARAWVNHSLGDEVEVEHEIEDVLADMNEDPITIDDSADIDSTLSWMFVALADEPETEPEGASNDG